MIVVVHQRKPRFFVFKNGSNFASFCLFSFFSKYQDKNSTPLTGISGTQTWGCTMEGADEATELFRFLLQTLSKLEIFKC